MAKIKLKVRGFKGFHKLKINEEGTITSKIMDQEGDVFDLFFLNDGGVEIQTEGFSHINLTPEDLDWLKEATLTAERHYKLVRESMSNGVFFKLLKPFGPHEAGEVFDCYEGLLYGIATETEKINFNDPEWFKLI